MSPGSAAPGMDPYDALRVRHAPGLLRVFNDAGVLAPADVHVATRLGTLLGDEDEGVLLAAALAVRAPRLGSVCVDLATVKETVVVDAEQAPDPQGLPWPDHDGWVSKLAASPLVATGGATRSDRPLRLIGARLYLDRYWRDERQIATDLNARGDSAAEGVNLKLLAAGLARLFPGEDPDDQRLAAASAVLRRFSVVAGGPGTGKTTTVAAILALLIEQARAAGSPPLQIGLAAPTGKAAARLTEAVHAEAEPATFDVDDSTRTLLLATQAATLHRLLGSQPYRSETRFRYHRGNRLPHDVIVVDETSMVSLSHMARLVEAVRPDARLVLVGDPEQLASVEAGAVLGDIVGPAEEGLRMRARAREILSLVARQEVPATDPPAGSRIGDGIVVLRHVHRFGGGIAELAQAIHRGDADAVVAVLSQERDDVCWIPADVAEQGAGSALRPVRAAVVDAGRRVTEQARAGRAREALEALGAFRLLCAHRHGPYGVATWMPRAEAWLAAGIEGFAVGGPWYVGRPLLVTHNDYGLGLFNGDTGVLIAGAEGRVAAAFERNGGLLEVSPTRLAAIDTVYAMTIHKSQGSQFGTVAVVLPDPSSPILTRELLYTAVTRARRKLMLVGTENAVRAAVERPIGRASGLRALLWTG